jgi:hypothetical protein
MSLEGFKRIVRQEPPPVYNAIFYYNRNQFIKNPIFYDDDMKPIRDSTFFVEDNSSGQTELTPRERITPHFKFPIYNSNGVLIKTVLKEVRLQKLGEKDGKPIFNIEPMELFDFDEDETIASLSNNVTTSADPHAEEVRDAIRKKYGKTPNSPFLTEVEERQLSSSKGVITLIGDETALTKLKKFLDEEYIPFLQKYYEHNSKRVGNILKNLNKMTTKNFAESYFELVQRELLDYAKRFPNLGLHLAEVYSNLETMKKISEDIPHDIALFKQSQGILVQNSQKFIKNINDMINSVEGKRARTTSSFKLGPVPGLGGGRRRPSRQTKGKGKGKGKKTKRKQK